MVGDIVSSLRANGELNRTLIVFTSDNGFLLGEHRIRTGKQFPYEPSIRVPLLMRGPGHPEERGPRPARRQRRPRADDPADYGQATTGLPPDGRSVRRLIDDPELEPGRAIVLENWCQTNERLLRPRGRPLPRRRTTRFAYMEYPNGEREMYDLDRDPDEMKSLQDKTKYDAEEAALHALLEPVQDCAGAACRTAAEAEAQARLRHRAAWAAASAAPTPPST